MAPVRSCPICYKVVVGFSQHLRYVHHVRNSEERVLLCKWQSGRVNVRQEQCPVSGCSTHLSRLDRHIDSHSELNRAQRRQVLEDLRRRLTMERLAVLRASTPDIPMATDLDIVETVRREEEEEEMLCSPTEAEEEVDCKEDSCHCHAPILRLKKAVKERDEALHTRSETNKSIKEDNLKLISDLQRLRKKYQLRKRQMGIGMVKALNFQAESDTDTNQEEQDQARGSGDQREEPTVSGSSCKLIFPGSAMSKYCFFK